MKRLEPTRKLDGQWPAGTWFQRRLLSTRIASAVAPFGTGLVDAFGAIKEDQIGVSGAEDRALESGEL
jgi:hypothetical protein